MKLRKQIDAFNKIFHFCVVSKKQTAKKSHVYSLFFMTCQQEKERKMKSIERWKMWNKKVVPGKEKFANRCGRGRSHPDQEAVHSSYCVVYCTQEKHPITFAEINISKNFTIPLLCELCAVAGLHRSWFIKVRWIPHWKSCVLVFWDVLYVGADTGGLLIFWLWLGGALYQDQVLTLQACLQEWKL